MGRMQTVAVVGSLVWAAVAAAIAFASLGDVNRDARLVLGVLSVLLPLAAVAAARLIQLRRYRLAATFLLLSAATPTYGAWALNALPIVLAVFLVRAGTEASEAERSAT